MKKKATTKKATKAKESVADTGNAKVTFEWVAANMEDKAPPTQEEMDALAIAACGPDDWRWLCSLANTVHDEAARGVYVSRMVHPAMIPVLDRLRRACDAQTRVKASPFSGMALAK